MYDQLKKSYHPESILSTCYFYEFTFHRILITVAGRLHLKPAVTVDTRQDLLLPGPCKLCGNIPPVKQALKPLLVKLVFKKIANLP